MNRHRSGAAKVALIGGISALLVAGAATAGVLAVQAKRSAFVHQALAIVAQAEDAYAAGRFPEAARAATDATGRLASNPSWFEAADEARIRDAALFLAGQQDLWGRAQAANSGLATDPARVRAGLEAIATEARAAAPRSRPLSDRLEPLLQAALARERESVEGEALRRLPLARSAYESGNLDKVLEEVAQVRASLDGLPAATREAAALKVARELAPAAEEASRVAALREIRDGAEEGPVKADRLRALIRALPDRENRDHSFHQALLKTIASVDPETRDRIEGDRLPKARYRDRVGAFSKDDSLRVIGKLDDRTVIELQGPEHRYAIRYVSNGSQVIVEVDRVRLAFGSDQVEDRETLCLEAAAEYSRLLRAARHPRAFADEAWNVVPNAPGPCLINVSKGQAWLLLDRRFFEGTLDDAPDSTATFQAFRGAAIELERAVRESAIVSDEIEGPLAAFLNAAHTQARPNDHLNGEFCRRAIHAGYVEAQLQGADPGIAAALKEYRRHYEELVRFHPRLEARGPEGATLTWNSTLEDGELWKLVDPAAKTTTFSCSPRDCFNSKLTVQSVFAGTRETFPDGEDPIEIRMAHPVAGVVARWKAAGGAFEADATRWAAAVTFGAANPAAPQFGTGDFQTPPHALKVDATGQARELILPAGALKIVSFDAIPAGPARREAQEAFLKRCAAVMRTPGELHLFFRYFVQYVLDSPVTTATKLVGSSRHTGDVHQDALQTLDRSVAGLFLADCDDLAEVYAEIARRQGRLAYVLSVPGHATCGYAEKEGGDWVFTCVDTGPARQLRGPDLDEIVEQLLRSYDREGGMSFDPRQMHFLFRFAGEQTRTTYVLDSRILRDAPYAELMIRVQEYWHFSFYALAIETMAKVVETDPAPANSHELAALYLRVGMFTESLAWTRTGIQQLDAKDRLTRLREEAHRVARCLRELKRKDEALQSLRSVAAEIAGIVKAEPREADRFRRLRFETASELAEAGDPWEGWKLVKDDVNRLVRAKAASEPLMALLTFMYDRMQRVARSGTPLPEAQAKDLQEVGTTLAAFYASGLFKNDDSFGDLMRKYAQLFGWYSAVDGPEKAHAALLRPGTPTEKRNHLQRRGAAAELDWAWIRLSPYAYSAAVGHALDPDRAAPEGPKEAVAAIRAMEAALPEMRKQASLGTSEFIVLELQLLAGCLEMDLAAIRGVFAEMKRQGWGELYEGIAERLGAAARFMKPEDFEKVFRLFGEYDVPRRHYYRVVYGARSSEAPAQALAASKICIEKFPGDADMRREHAQLEKLPK